MDMSRSQCMGPDDFSLLRTVRKVLFQQTFLLDHQPKELRDRIVSLHKPYVRPIKRGKENKPVEFGMKVHMLQVDGLSILDAMSFQNFNETTRLNLTVLNNIAGRSRSTQLGADRIYASNGNRRHTTGNKRFYCFHKKGPKKQSPAARILSRAIARKRATVT